MTETPRLPNFRCPLCHVHLERDLRLHIVDVHGENALRKAILADKEQGMSDAEVGRRYGISFGVLEQIMTEAYGANVTIRRRPKHIKQWQPPNFRLETSTVWSFRQRGDWATHNGGYRGNWSPYIPRNAILRYSKPGDTVLDYFVGGGTTAIEAKLLGRRCIARDINPDAVEITKNNLAFSSPDKEFLPVYEPVVKVGDARDLSDISTCSIDLICAHPPYAGIVKYSTGIEGDLSSLTAQEFLTGIRQVAEESLRVLKPGGKCVILIGDSRKSKHVVPIGFETIRVFLDTGFVLHELVIKRQHNCRATGFWYTRSLQYNFMLLAHEYLPIFEKPADKRIGEQLVLWETFLSPHTTLHRMRPARERAVEATTVWVFPEDRLESEVRRNLATRFAPASGKFLEVQFREGEPNLDQLSGQNLQLLYIRMSQQETEEALANHRAAVKRMVAQSETILPAGGFLVLEARDFYTQNSLVPAGLLLWEDMTHQDHFALKEIVIVAPEKTATDSDLGDCLKIVHEYLLVYQRRSTRREEMA